MTSVKYLANGVLSDEYNDNEHITEATANSLASKPLDAVCLSSRMGFDLEAEINENPAELHGLSGALNSSDDSPHDGRDKSSESKSGMHI